MKRTVLATMLSLTAASVFGASFAQASVLPDTRLIGTWVGPNCAGQPAWENTVRLTLTKDDVSGKTPGEVSYIYSSGTCESELTLTSRSGDFSYWDDNALTRGCIDGEVTMRFVAHGSGSFDDTLWYTWSDPTGSTPTCTGPLRRAP